jgi:hypothetical protein
MQNYNIPFFGVIQAMTSTLPHGAAVTTERRNAKKERSATINPLRLLGARR